MKRLKAQLCEALKRQLASEQRRLPEGGQLLWQWFTELHAARSWNTNGPNPVSYREIAIYRQLTGWPMEERHIQILRAMDDAWLAGHYQRQRGENPDVSKVAPVSTRAMTTVLFDAMFG